MDFITCDAFVVQRKEGDVYELSLEPINIRKDKILMAEMVDVVSEFGTFDGDGNILSGELQDGFTRLIFEPEYFQLICANLAIKPLTCSIERFSSDQAENECSIVVSIDFSVFIEENSVEYHTVW